MKSKAHHRIAALLVVSLTAPAISRPAAPPALPANFISPIPPTDIPGGAQNATLTDAAIFAWQEFIALNWPAQTSGPKGFQRDTPAVKVVFGDPNYGGPLVWHTFRGKVETFPGTGNPPGYNTTDPSFGYDYPPTYTYGSPVPPCADPVSTPAWINLDEVTQIGLDVMYAGVVPNAASPTNSDPQRIRFMAKGNRSFYTYVAGNGYFDQTSTAYQTAIQNFQAGAGATPPQTPAEPYIHTPPGTFLVKAAWRQLAPNEDPTRFYRTRVRYYEPSGQSGQCYREAEWALIALHIIQKTPTAPSFIYATFEQADNILDTSGKPIEDVNGSLVTNPPASPTNPPLKYTDDPTKPLVSVDGPYCNTTNSPQLFYKENPNKSGLPSQGSICINARDSLIPPAVISVNTVAHGAIAAYSAQHNLGTSPWQYYKLISVQSTPFDKSQINNQDPNSPRSVGVFYQANIVVETDYTLQRFSGRISVGGPPTDYPAQFAPPPAPPPNVYVFQGGTTPARTYNMGGCMGCHGNAELAGTDFSFTLLGGRVGAPETPGDDAAVTARRYERLFNSLMPYKK